MIDLIKRLRLHDDERLYKEADELMSESADALDIQAERIAELERESETHSKAYGLAIVERDNLRHELKVAQEGWRCECSTDDACRFARERDALRAELEKQQVERLLRIEAGVDALVAERDALRAQLAAIAATEPVGYAYGNQDFIGSVIGAKGEWAPREIALFTRPMPALNPVWCNGDEPLVGGGLIRQGRVDMQIRTALSKYKGAK